MGRTNEASAKDKEKDMEKFADKKTITELFSVNSQLEDEMR